MVFIEVKLFASLASKTPSDSEAYKIEPGLTVAGLLQLLDVPVDEAKLIFVDGVRCPPNTPLNGGERVGIFPPVGGG